MNILKKIHFAFSDPLYRKPKPDYIKYFEDMHRFTKAYLDKAMLKQNTGYSFSELIDLAINENKILLPTLNNANLCVIIYDTYDYDSYYSHLAPYLVEKYNIQADFLDLMGQGSLESALHIVQTYFEQKKIGNAVILKFAQRALPLRHNINIILPKYNSVDVIVLNV